MKRLTLAEYLALPHAERTALRRAAFGAPGFEQITAGYDVVYLRMLLTRENERTGDIPARWTEQGEDE